ncbi:uncharacterized protein EI90DRAFT_283180 [Cantharellus anzutake]|uniref:uncharacterized protein n=1 Tax=Cantharellus anzutake TaxID=1750568 RepID=UPI00190659A7|nr:uncharacterized protein EI90DRAFT_283180 [Cantharellus anzutake]KAF8335972.1 hypothetical protein EI90DRAFT_283180 [Cantharellus anzutake]
MPSGHLCGYYAARFSAFQCGIFLLLVALPCLVIATFSAPIWEGLGFMTIEDIAFYRRTGYQGRFIFGTFGHCHTGLPGDHVCLRPTISYDIGAVLSVFNDTYFSSKIGVTLKHLTKALFLLPITAVLVLIALIAAIPSRFIERLFSALIATVACVLMLLSLILELVLFSIVERHVKGAKTNWGPATKLIIAGFL